MEASPPLEENSKPPRGDRAPRRTKSHRLERDIFGDEFLGSRRVLNFTLNLDELPEGARAFLKILIAIPLEFSVFEDLVRDALLQVSPAFWEEELERYTPDEWKIFHALEDETFRKNVEDLLGASSSKP